MSRSWSRRKVLAGAGGAALLAPLWPRDGVAGEAVLEGPTMGTRYRVVLAAPPPGVDPGDLRSRLEGALERVEQLMSTYRPDSELSRFNRGAPATFHPVSDETLAVVDHALRVGRLTGGAFDPTVGALVGRWGFGAEVPCLAGAPRDGVGLGRLSIRSAPSALMRDREGVFLDLSGIAKGFGLDRVCALLDAAGVRDYLVEIGGELRARGRKAGGGPWLVGIERPVPGERRIGRVVRLEGLAIATSGDYLDFYESGGRRYSHIIDPRSGAPVDHGLAAVTVLAASAMQADAMATALMVLGPEAGLGLARRLGLAALFTARGGAGFVERSTPGFDRVAVA